MQQIRYSKYSVAAGILLDLIIISGVFIAFYFVNFYSSKGSSILDEHIATLLLMLFLWGILSEKTRLYYIPRNIVFTVYLEKMITQLFFFGACFFLLAKVSNLPFLQSKKFLMVSILSGIILLIKTLTFLLVKYLRKNGYNHRNIMFLEENSSTDILKNMLELRKDFGYKTFLYNDDFNDLASLESFWKKNGIHTIFIPTDGKLEKKLKAEIVQKAENNKISICLLPSTVENDFFRYDFTYLDALPILTPSIYPLSRFTNALFKRTIDTLASVLFFTVIGFWLFPIIAFLIKIDSKGPVFFIQKRYGFQDKVFNCFKFRTMVINEDSSIKVTTENDSRITRIGKFLRKTSLDELPQFFNVFKGEMSLVGPRPHMLLVDDHYKTKIGRYSIRSMVKPGITGLAQVNGLRGDTGNRDLEMKKRILADTYYVKNWSIALDVGIILKTIYIFIKGDKKAL